MNPREFYLDPAAYGMPTRDELVAYRIWDNHFHGFASTQPVEQYERNSVYVERMGIEMSVAQEIGGTLNQPFAPYEHDAAILRILERDRDRLCGRTPIDPTFPDQSCAKIEKWIRDGPCIAIKYPGGAKPGVRCSHPNNDSIMRLAEELEVHVYIHTWLQVGGIPRRPGGKNGESEATPMDLVALAQRFPRVQFICGHTGGDWELGLRTVRPCRNILVEYSGSDPHSGMIELGLKELGEDRLVFGGHGPSRSYATEMGKVLDADITRAQRMKIFGGNLRRISAAAFQKKGRRIEV